METQNILNLLDLLRAMAQEGLSYSKNEYDTARYNKLLDLASQQYSTIVDMPSEKIRGMFLRETGSITPKLGVDSAIMNTENKLLLLRRNDGSWGLPGGWMDVGESPFETAHREALEETGLHTIPIGYVLVTHKTPLTHTGFVSQVNICVAAKRVPANTKVTLSHEHTAFRWIDEHDEFDNWHPGQQRLIKPAFEAYRKQLFLPEIS